MRVDDARLTDANHLYFEQRSELLQFSCNVSNPDRAMMRRPLCIPALHKFPDAERKTVAAVRVSNLKNGSGYRLPFCNDKF